MKQAIVTICSRSKDESAGLLSAGKRYTGGHIKKVNEIAKSVNEDLYFLSGLYGLISADEQIPYYDYLLTDGAVEEMSEKVSGQLLTFNISDVSFYSKSDWGSYNEVMKNACKKAGVRLQYWELG